MAIGHVVGYSGILVGCLAVGGAILLGEAISAVVAEGGAVTTPSLILTLATAIGVMVGPAVNAWLIWKTAQDIKKATEAAAEKAEKAEKAAKDAAAHVKEVQSNAEEVRKVLVTTSAAAAGKLDEVLDTSNKIHKLTNDRMGVALEVNKVLAFRLAAKEGATEADRDYAQASVDALDEHNKQQFNVDASEAIRKKGS